MFMGRVIGSVWATRKHPPLESGRFVLVQPVDESLKADGAPLAALDTIGSGPGEIVLYITSYEAVLPWKDQHPHLDVVGVDASVVAVVDRVEASGERGS